VKKVKKIMAYIIIILISISIINISYTKVEANDLKLTDVKEGDWFKSNVELLIGKGIVNGYTDGTFKPSNTVTKAQFIKMAITSIGRDDIQLDSEYWANNYINVAYQEGYIESKYSKDQNYEAPITRGEMAIIIAKIINEEASTQDIIKYADEIKDIDKVNGQDMLYIIETYKYGILKGYPDGEFKPNNNATRAEASTMIVRLLDKIKDRSVPQVISGTGGN